MPTAVARRSIAEQFASLAGEKRIALMPFIPAGYPDLETTAKCLPALEAAGASIIEIGIPFSDPVADGPVIQEAFGFALAKKLKLVDVFATIKAARSTISIPLVAMVSYSIVYRFGVDRFCATMRDAGFDGLILPDLPPPEAESVCQRVRGSGLETILLVAPTTPRERRMEIARLTSGFVYYMSVTGITGERTDLPRELADGVREMKGLSDRPVCVGFGVSTAAHVAQLAGVADGAIVGSALVRRMKQHAGEGADAIAEAAGAYCRELLSGVR